MIVSVATRAPSVGQSGEDTSAIGLTGYGCALLDRAQEREDTRGAAISERSGRLNRHGGKSAGVVLLRVELPPIHDEHALGVQRIAPAPDAVPHVAPDGDQEARLDFDDDVAVRDETRRQCGERCHCGRGDPVAAILHDDVA